MSYEIATNQPLNMHASQVSRASQQRAEAIYEIKAAANALNNVVHINRGVLPVGLDLDGVRRMRTALEAAAQLIQRAQEADENALWDRLADLDRARNSTGEIKMTINRDQLAKDLDEIRPDLAAEIRAMIRRQRSC